MRLRRNVGSQVPTLEREDQSQSQQNMAKQRRRSTDLVIHIGNAQRKRLRRSMIWIKFLQCRWIRLRVRDILSQIVC